MSDVVIVAILAAITVAALPCVSSSAYRSLTALTNRIAERPARAILLCGLVSFLGSMAVALFVMWPEPRVHDEFSYLLAADTFAHGRLTNPTHPLWQHFESFHIFHQPTYASKYPPAQGLVLALGTVSAGSPVVGLWLSGAFMCAAICWMLYGFVPPRWALLGGLVAAAKIGIATYWTQTFWGGAVAATGGALVFGAAARIERAPRTLDALLFGLGLVILANSRPFEGALTSLAAVPYLAFAITRQRVRVGAIAVPIFAVLAIGGIGMAGYNRAVVGSWWLPPYIHHEQTYAVRPTLTFQQSRPPPAFRHEVMRKFYVGATKPGSGDAPGPTPGGGAGARAVDAAQKLRNFLAGRALLIPFFFGIVAAFSSLRAAMLVGSIALALASVSVNYYFKVHYAAPLTASVFALVAIGLARIESLSWRGLAIGRAVCMAIALATLGSLALEIGHVPAIHTVNGTDDFYYRRLRALDVLNRSPGRDLVVVEYGPDHNVHREWVYNAADIDAADVVWARSMGPERDRELVDYFSGRRAWTFRDGFGPAADGLEPRS